jgi:hypothetical protein
MKKIYSLLLLVIASTSFGQQILSEDFNYPDSALLTGNGWTAHSGAGTNAVDVGVSNGLTYTGYSGLTGFTAAAVGNAARLDNTGEDVNKAFAAPVTSGSLYYSFMINVTTAVDGYFISLGTGTTTLFARLYAKPSATAGKVNFGIGNNAVSYSTTDFDIATTYLAVIKYDVSATGSVSLWIIPAGIPATEAAAGTPTAINSGAGSATVGGAYLRQYNLAQNITIDGIRIYPTWFNTAACPLTLGTETTLCDAVTLGIDTYTATIPFTGGNSGTYTLATTSGTIGGDNPSTVATGNITISNITEATGVTLTVSGGCGFTKIIAPSECKPINPLPYGESFPYTAGNSLGLEQKWVNVNTGDNIVAAAGSLNYPGYTSSGNSVAFSGAGIECFTPFTTTTTGTIYAAFIINVTDVSNMTATVPESYFAGLTGANKSIQARLFVKKTAAQYQLGFDSASTTTNYDATLRNPGDVVYVVMGYDFATNLLKAWFNPDLATFTAATTPTLTNTPVVVLPATSLADLGGFLLRQDTATTTPTITFDELRVATTTPALLAVAQNSITGLRVYPNPVSNGTLFVETSANSEKTIVIYDILGKQVLNTTTTSIEVNVANLKGGLYIVKITEEGKTATRKLVIR